MKNEEEAPASIQIVRPSDGGAVTDEEKGTEIGPVVRANTLAEWEPLARVIQPDEEAELESYAALSPTAPVYLKALITFGNHAAACAAIGIDPSTPRKWKQKDSRFAMRREEIQEEIKERWNAVCQHRALNGFEERMYDKEGRLAGRKVRQDPSFLKAVMGSIDDRWSSREGSSWQPYIINIVRTAE